MSETCDFTTQYYRIQKLITAIKRQCSVDRAKWIKATSELKHLQPLPSRMEILKDETRRNTKRAEEAQD